eukprot:SAG11_NODE_8718_length_983_cov_3.359729_2_plen_53_part_00
MKSVPTILGLSISETTLFDTEIFPVLVTVACVLDVSEKSQLVKTTLLLSDVP